MHYLALLCPTAVALGLVGFVLYKNFLQQKEQEQQYWAPFRALSAADPEPTMTQQLLTSVEAQLRLLRGLPPGTTRSRKVRQLRAQYHPDRWTELQQSAVFSEVSSIVNNRTQTLLDEDAAAPQS